MTVRVGTSTSSTATRSTTGCEQRACWPTSGTSTGPAGRVSSWCPGCRPTSTACWWPATIDLGPISSIAYARNHRRLLLSRRLSHLVDRGGGQHPAGHPTSARRDPRRVALTPQSATSVALLKTILKLRFEQDVGVRASCADPSGGGPGRVRRGAAHRRPGAGGPVLPRPGTRLPRPGRAVAGVDRPPHGLRRLGGAGGVRPHATAPELRAVEEELVGCMDYGREHLDGGGASRPLGRYRFDRACLTRYFACLHYDFTEEYQAGPAPLLRAGVTRPASWRRCRSCASSTRSPVRRRRATAGRRVTRPPASTAPADAGRPHP